jgi:hypothetical protein
MWFGEKGFFSSGILFLVKKGARMYIILHCMRLGQEGARGPVTDCHSVETGGETFGGVVVR